MVLYALVISSALVFCHVCYVIDDVGCVVAVVDVVVVIVSECVGAGVGVTVYDVGADVGVALFCVVYCSCSSLWC